jgi:hypothetical protein
MTDINLDGIETTPWGARVVGDISFDTFAMQMRESAAALRKHKFILGDLIRWYHEHREFLWGELYDDLISWTGLSYGFLANAKSIAMIIPFEHRNPEWKTIRSSHFRAVRILPTLDERLRALDRADREQYTYEELCGYVRQLMGKDEPPRRLIINVNYSHDDAGRERLAEALFDATGGDPRIPDTVNAFWSERDA